jgi:Zn finger protein HypA/HybF involved in hydrogenase expression
VTFTTTVVKYVANNVYVTVICIQEGHGGWQTTPTNHHAGNVCPLCSRADLWKTTEQFVKDARRVHGDCYQYDKVRYAGSQVKIVLVCSTHGDFLQTPNHHLKGSGCPKCAKRNYSVAQIQWLQLVALQTAAVMQTVESEEGEHRIGNYSVDGFCAQTNTVFEYNGCFWHGCPMCFPKRDQVAFEDSPKNRLYNTVKHAQSIHNQGYHLDVMWEHTWNNFIRVVRKLQSAFRQRQAAKEPSAPPNKRIRER